jgi:hypothetical protein
VCDREPLVPVTTTETVPTDVKSHDRLPLPDPVSVAGVIVQAVLLDDRLTVPAKPFRPVTLMVEVPADPALTVTVLGLAAIEKS